MAPTSRADQLRRKSKHQSTGLYIKRNTFILSSSREELRAAAYAALTGGNYATIHGYNADFDKEMFEGPDSTPEGASQHSNRCGITPLSEENKRIKDWINGVPQFSSPQEFHTAPRSPTSEMLMNYAVRRERDKYNAKGHIHAASHRKAPLQRHSHSVPSHDIQSEREVAPLPSMQETPVEMSDLGRELSTMIQSLSQQKKAEAREKVAEAELLMQYVTSRDQGRPTRRKPLGEHTMTSQRPRPVRPISQLSTFISPENSQQSQERGQYRYVAPEISFAESRNGSRNVEDGSTWVSRDRDGQLRFERKAELRRSQSARYPASRSDDTMRIKAIPRCQVM